ncbi:MAG: putative metal-binding motif-containing protein [Sandaracinaceae bacterium]|nr:putative metal-binding motif-containing protein [Sandaracinaceae bacterium]MBK8410103.1 putative metal-binding motif-containing protein [Sandaracinaceae bacterium]MBP7682619.1 putative metal-binding motif-containing protein [Deltaproteobacteria bacterium]
MRRLAWGGCALVLVACGGSPSTGDAGGVACETNSDCDDMLYCSGEERCLPSDERADARGCVAGLSPCEGVCDEAADSCPLCGAAADLDSDGHASILCGGSDCDDDDPERFPGNPEVCDAGSHDEDCDPTTFGGRDGDSDGYVDDACCNVGPSGLVCGDDCDDTSAGVSPGDGEACDTRDNDCDGVIDDGVPPGVYYRDLDRDGAGDPNARLEACTPPSGYVLGNSDCDDMNMGRAPTNVETCNGQDDDCDEEIDEDQAGTGANCTVAGASGTCSVGVLVCDAAGTGVRCVARTSATAEECNGQDDDCDTNVDEGVPGVGAPCTAPGTMGACAMGTLRCMGAAGTTCSAGTPSVEACSPVDEDCDGDPINRGQPNGFACLTGEPRGCSVCGMNGTETCVAGCSWSRVCNVGGVGSTVSWAANDPRFQSNVFGYCSSVPGGSRCCDHPGGQPDAYCLTGGGVTLAPATYELRMFGGRGDDMTIEIADTTNGAVRASRAVTTCGAWSERLTFVHPRDAGCANYEFRLRVDGGASGCYEPFVTGVELTRTSDLAL